MKRKVLDVVLFLNVCFLIGTGLLFEFRLVPGSEGGKGLTYFGCSRHEWGDLHLWAGYLFAALIGLHLVFSWNFIKNIFASKKAFWLIGLALIGVVIIGFFFAFPLGQSLNATH